MSLEFAFRKAPVQAQWRGRWLRGIELDQQRFEARAAAQRRRSHFEHDAHREPSVRLLEAWAPVEDDLRRCVELGTLDDLSLRLWLAPVHPHSLIGGTWRLGCDERAICWLRDRFGRLLEGCAGRPVEFVVCEGSR